jgi:hypothetical protein
MCGGNQSTCVADDKRGPLVSTTVYRTVLLKDLQDSHLYLQQFEPPPAIAETVPKTTAVGTSAAVLNHLAIGALSNKIGELETGIKTTDLRKQASDLQSELKATRRALAPGSKAALTFTFVPFENVALGKEVVLITTETVMPNPDGSVHLQFTVLNLTTVDALQGDLTLTICESCRFAKEPALFKKLDANSDKERTTVHFVQILARTPFPNLSVDIIRPPSLNTSDSV